MSTIIRAVRQPWLAPPRDSIEVRAPIPRDSYRLAQIAMEAAQRAEQRRLDRLSRAGWFQPPTSPVRQLSVQPQANFVINLPVR